MNANLAAEAESLDRTATRLRRVSLIVDRNVLSPTHHRAAFALQCLAANVSGEVKSKSEHAPIGFDYLNAR